MTLQSKLKDYFTKQANDDVYSVQSGDTLSHIAKRKGIPIEELSRFNNITNPDRINVGQEIRIPSAQAAPSQESQFPQPVSPIPPHWYDSNNNVTPGPVNQPTPAAPRAASGKTQAPLVGQITARGESHPPIPQGVEDTGQLAKWISHWEEFSEEPYLDTGKVPTIGYGTTRYPDGRRVSLRDPRITQDQALQYKHKYIDQMMKDMPSIVSNYSQLHPQAQAILADMRYNLGPYRLKGFENMRAALEANNYTRAAEEAKDSAWYGQVGRRSEHHYNALRQLAEMMNR